MAEADPIDGDDQKENEKQLKEKVQPDLQALNSLRFRFCRSLSHSLQPPFARLERLISERECESGHAQIKDNRPHIDHAPRVRSHVLDRRKISKRVEHFRAQV